MNEMTLTSPYSIRDKLCHFSLLATVFFIPLSAFLLNISILMTVMLALCCAKWRQRLGAVLKNPVAVAGLLLIAVFIIGALFSEASGESIQIAFHKYSKLLYIPLLMPLFHDEATKSQAIHVFLAAMLLTVVLTITNLLAITHIGADYSAVFKNRIETSFLLAFAAYVTMHRAWFDQALRPLYVGVCLLFCIDLLLINQGRTGYLVFMVLTALLLFQHSRWRGLLVATMGLSVLFGLLVVLPTPFRARLQQTTAAIDKLERGIDLSHYTQHGKPSAWRLAKPKEDSGKSILLRVQFLRNSLTLLEGHWLFGRGVGCFRELYFQNFGPFEVVGNHIVKLQDPHNEYLMIAVQLGAVGFACWILLLALEWRASLRIPGFWGQEAQAFVAAFAVASGCDAFLFLSAPGHFFVCFSALYFSSVSKGGSCRLSTS